MAELFKFNCWLKAHENFYGEFPGLLKDKWLEFFLKDQPAVYKAVIIK